MSICLDSTLVAVNLRYGKAMKRWRKIWGSARQGVMTSLRYVLYPPLPRMGLLNHSYSSQGGFIIDSPLSSCYILLIYDSFKTLET